MSLEQSHLCEFQVNRNQNANDFCTCQKYEICGFLHKTTNSVTKMTFFLHKGISKKSFSGCRYYKWNLKPTISPIFHFYWVNDGWVSGLLCKILIMYTILPSLNLKKIFLNLELHNPTKTSHHITASSGMCFSKNFSCPWPFNAKVLVSPEIFQVVFSQSSYGHPCF